MTTRIAKRPRRVHVSLYIQFIVALLFAMVILVPLATAIINGFKTNAELLLSPFSLPEVPKVEN